MKTLRISRQGHSPLTAVLTRALCLMSAVALPTLSAHAAHWNKLECSSIPSSGAPSYDTTIQCVAEITKPGAAKWYNALRQNCSTFCSSLRGASVASPDGFWCTSGENRPWSAINARVDYSPTGCWHSCSQPEGTTGANSVGERCYAPGQKRDNDRTDITVGCFCQTGDIGAGLLDVGLSSSGTAQARAVAPAAVANWARVSKNVANDGSGRMFNIVGDVTVGNTASITMSVNVQGACGSTVSISGLLSQANGAQVPASPYTITLPACVPACRDGIDNDGDDRIDLADPDCSNSDDTSETNNSQEVFRNSDIVMGYASAAAPANVEGYPNCFTSIGDSMWIRSDNSANRTPSYNVSITNGRITVAQNAHVSAKAAYVCLRGQTVAGARIKAGYIRSGTLIDANMSCVLSVGNFSRVRPADGGPAPGTVTCSYNPSTGEVTASHTGQGRISECGYVCAAPSSTSSSVSAYRYPSTFGGSESLGANLSCARGTTNFSTKCSTVTVAGASYVASTGLAAKGFADGCTNGSFSYLCASASATQCSDNRDNDADGLIDAADPGCSNAQDNSEGEWTPSCVQRANCPTQAIYPQATRLDVDKDCLITESDAVLITDHLKKQGLYRSDYDVNDSPDFLGDGILSPIDPLTIANFLKTECRATTPVATETASPLNTPTSTPSITPTLAATSTNGSVATPTASPISSPLLTATTTATSVSPTTPLATPESSFTATPATTRAAASVTPESAGSSTPGPTLTPTSDTQQTPVWPDQVGLIIFVPSTPFDPRASYDGRTGGPEAADAFCRQRALIGNLVTAHSRWRALISTSSRDARDLTGVSATSGNIVNRRGDVLATNRAALWDASTELANAPGYNEFGDAISVSVATGSDARGTRLAPNFCSDFTDANSTLSGAGVSSERSRSWISKSQSSPATCALINLYCVGNVQPVAPTGTPQTTPTTASSETPIGTPTRASSGTPGATPTTISSGTPIASPTGSPTANSSGGNSVSTPGISATNTAIATRASGETGELNSSTPSPTPSTSGTPGTPGKPGQVSGKVEADGKEIPGALIYAPSVVNVVLSMKDGTWVMPELQDSSANLLLKIRSTQLSNSGVDIPAAIGTTLQLKSLKMRNYNPDKCKENDHLLSLYNAALRVRALWLASAEDHKVLSTSKVQAANGQESGRALRRAHYHAQTFLELSALLPDRELVCSSGQRSCPSVSYNRVIRAMRQSATHLRHESLLFNRKLRLAGSRSEAESKQRIQGIRSGTRRLRVLIQKLPLTSFDCSAPQSAPARQLPQKSKLRRSSR